MAKVEEYRSMDQAQLESALDERREDLFRLRLQIATHQLDDNSQIGKARKDISRILTVLTEKNIAIKAEDVVEG